MSISIHDLNDKQKSLIADTDRKALGKAGETTAEAIERAVIKSERELQETLVQYLHLHGVRFVHRSRMDKRTTANLGTPDLLFACTAWTVLRNPRIYACAWEVKLPGKSPVAIQTATMAEMRRDGWQVAVIHSITEAKAELQRLGVI